MAPPLLGAAGGLAAPHGGVLRHWSEEPSGGRVRLGGEGRQPGRDGGVARGLRRVPGASSCWRLGYAREDRNGKTRHGPCLDGEVKGVKGVKISTFYLKHPNMR